MKNKTDLSTKVRNLMSDICALKRIAMTTSITGIEAILHEFGIDNVDKDTIEALRIWPFINQDMKINPDKDLPVFEGKYEGNYYGRRPWQTNNAYIAAIMHFDELYTLYYLIEPALPSDWEIQ